MYRWGAFDSPTLLGNFCTWNHFWAQTNPIKPPQWKQADPGSGFLNPIKGVCPVLNRRGEVDTQESTTKSSTRFVCAVMSTSDSIMLRVWDETWDLSKQYKTEDGRGSRSVWETCLISHYFCNSNGCHYGWKMYSSFIIIIIVINEMLEYELIWFRLTRIMLA